MKRSNIFSVMALALGLTLGLASCVNDDSSEGNQSLPELSIKGSDATTLPIKNVYLGNECDIKPELSYTGNMEDLKYQWKVGTYVNGVKGELREVSTEPELKYNFTTGGSYYVHLTVTDGKVGQVMEYQVNVNRTFEEGYLLSSVDADGKGNLSFVKVLTPEEIAAGTKEVVMEHCMTRQNPNISEDGLVKAVSGTETYPATVTRIMVSTKERCYFLEPNNFTVLSSIAYTDLYPGFQASEFIPWGKTPYAYDKNMKKFATLDLSYMFPYEYKYLAGLEMEDCLVSDYLNTYEMKNQKIFYVDYTKSQVSMDEPYAVSLKGAAISTVGEFMKGQKLLSAFETSNGSAVCILSENGDKVTLWKNTNAYNYYYLDEKDFKAETLDLSSNTAVPAQGARFVGSFKYSRMFYPVGNCVYVYLPKNAFALPNKDQYAIKFGESEEITYMDVNFDTEELYVATYDKNTQRGNFYIYDCKDVSTNNGGNVKAKEEHKGCAGRISYLMYKPSIQQ